MGITLSDLETDAYLLSINFWNWRPIVEMIRSLGLLPQELVDSLHEPFVGELTAAEAHAVAAEIRRVVLPALTAGQRVLLDGTRTTEPDDGTFHRAPADHAKNYGTTAAVLELFVRACEGSRGFRVG
jgi:hypothetical protein